MHLIASRSNAALFAHAIPNQTKSKLPIYAVTQQVFGRYLSHFDLSRDIGNAVLSSVTPLMPYVTTAFP